MSVANLFRQLTGRRSVAAEHRFIVICARHPEGVTPEQGYALRDLINAYQPIDWQFYNPSTFVALFLLAASDARANATALENALRVFSSPRLLGVGVAEGELFAELALDGRLLSWPLASTMSAAMKAAQEDQA